METEKNKRKKYRKGITIEELFGLFDENQGSYPITSSSC